MKQCSWGSCPDYYTPGHVHRNGLRLVSHEELDWLLGQKTGAELVRLLLLWWLPEGDGC